MQPATDATVLGRFDGSRYDGPGEAARFFRRDGDFWIGTTDRDGHAVDVRVADTFGVYPLQQYLVAQPGGRLQAFSVAWDARAKEAGGQRWFTLEPDALSPGDPFRWTGREHTWNFMCAPCHSTDLHKNYDLASDTYRTTWSDIDVACEACHGPGSRHVDWAYGVAPLGAAEQDGRGFDVRLRAADAPVWGFLRPDQAIARPLADPLAGTGAPARAEVCYPCHSRRDDLGAPPGAASRFLDRFRPAMTTPPLYEVDGRIHAEAFEFGSFEQSLMARAGVTCTNCHDPHGLGLRATGNALCSQCHRAAVFDTADHTHHASGSSGGQCTACHMPTSTYMGVHVRHDHGFRIPRPALSLADGTSNACTDCHRDRGAAWAAEAVLRWFGPAPAPGFPAVFAAAEHGLPATDRLAGVLADRSLPGIIRGTAAWLLDGSSPAATASVAGSAQDEDPLVRLGIAHAIAAWNDASRATLGTPLLGDTTRAVRVEAARSLADVPEALLGTAGWAAHEAATAEYAAMLHQAEDQPEAHLELSELALGRGRTDEAKAECRTALRIDPNFTPALVNLADLLRQEGRDVEGAMLLEQAAGLAPDDPVPLDALALLRVRQGRRGDAMDLFRKATAVAPSDRRAALLDEAARAEMSVPAR